MSFEVPGSLFYIPKFVFKNNRGVRDKYFLVLNVTKDDVVVSSLPSSVDYVPGNIVLEHGCIDQINAFNCYHFEKSHSICDTGFSFSKPTFLYGEWVDTYKMDELQKISTVKPLGILLEEELNKIIDCFKNSSKVKRKIKRLLQ